MKNKNVNISRRDFLKGSAAGLVAAGLPLWYSERAAAELLERIPVRRRKIRANDTIQLAVVGTGGSKGGHKMGLNVAHACARHEGVKIVAVCDVDQQHLDEAAAAFGPDCAKYHDFRDLLEEETVDGVIIGTPDHWHAFIAIAAMKAGKDVYCEKPLTLTIDEGKKLVDVWKQTGAVFQTGSQQRSEHGFHLACELVQNGRIGAIQRVEARLPGGPAEGPFPISKAPRDLDWNMWLGPAPWVPYTKERCHGNFRWWLDYSGGMLTDWGAHHNDIAQWGLGMDRTGPVSVQASGGGRKECDNCYDTFPQFDVDYVYANGIPLRTTNKGENGVRFEGEDGWIFVSRGKLEASDPRLIEDPLPENAKRLYMSRDHAGNYLEGMRTRRQPICDAEIGHRSVTLCHLANISLLLGGRKLEWDPKKEQFKGDDEANAMLARPRRFPWEL